MARGGQVQGPLALTGDLPAACEECSPVSRGAPVDGHQGCCPASPPEASPSHPLAILADCCLGKSRPSSMPSAKLTQGRRGGCLPVCVWAQAQRASLPTPMGPGGMGDLQGWGWEPSLPGSPVFPTLGCRKPLGGAHLGCRSGLCHFCPFSLPRVHVGPWTLTTWS